MKEFIEVVGWLMIAATMCSATLACGLLALNNLGRYNIGGVQNTFLTKLFTIIGIAILITCWVVLLQNSPFTFGLKG